MGILVSPHSIILACHPSTSPLVLSIAKIQDEQHQCFKCKVISCVFFMKTYHFAMAEDCSHLEALNNFVFFVPLRLLSGQASWCLWACVTSVTNAFRFTQFYWNMPGLNSWTTWLNRIRAPLRKLQNREWASKPIIQQGNHRWNRNSSHD